MDSSIIRVSSTLILNDKTLKLHLSSIPEITRVFDEHTIMYGIFSGFCFCWLDIQLTDTKTDSNIEKVSAICVVPMNLFEDGSDNILFNHINDCAKTLSQENAPLNITNVLTENVRALMPILEDIPDCVLSEKLNPGDLILSTSKSLTIPCTTITRYTDFGLFGVNSPDGYYHKPFVILMKEKLTHSLKKGDINDLCY